MLLAIDTSTRSLSLAVHDGRHVLAETTWLSRGRHTVELAPAAALIMQRAGVAPAGLSGVAVCIGPGSFTGLRIGLGFAKGVCIGNRLPLVGVPTLDVLAAAQPVGPESMLVTLLSAGRSRLAVGRYRPQGNHWTADGAPALMDWNALIESLPGKRGEARICGEIDADGFEMLKRVRGQVRLAPAAASLRRAGFLAELAWPRVRRGQVDDPATLAPIYLGGTEAAAA